MAASYAWIAWIALILVFIIVETVTVELVFAMLAVGCLGGLVGSLFSIPVWGQALVAAALSVVLLTVLRPRLLRRLRQGGDQVKSNIDALIGMSATVVSPVSATSGQVKLAIGEVWTARLAPPTSAVRNEETPILHTGDTVSVVEIDGATAVVRSTNHAGSTESNTEERNDQ